MKINIIGAGISGLSAGCYLQMNGFETEIFEKNPTPGGLCTNWKVGDYTFNGAIHWLLGSNDSSEFYKLWSELIDLESIEFVSHEIRVDLEVNDNVDKYGSKIFHLYTDLTKLEKYLTDIAPEDLPIIKKFIRSIRKIQAFELPPVIKSTPALYSLKQKMGMVRHLPLFLYMLRNRFMTNLQLAARFKNPFLREVFSLLYDGDDHPLLITTVPMAFADLKGTGYPVGGSFRFAKKMEEKYLSLGGKISYNAAVKEILVENNVARGIILESGREVRSDITFSSADWYFTIFEALKGKYVNKKIQDLKEGKNLQVYYSVLSVSLGISRTFTDYPHFSRFPIGKELISPDGTKYSRLELHIYNYDPTLAPKGKTSVAVSFYTMKGDFWIDLASSDRAKYDQVRNDFANEVIGLLEERIPGITKDIEVVSVATPATFYRYTNNWKGSTQGWLPGKNIMARSPVDLELPGLGNFYYSSHWSIPGGGLPVAIKSARDAALIICKKYNKKFSVPA